MNLSMATKSKARPGWACPARFGVARPLNARHGSAWLGLARRGTARQAWLVMEIFSIGKVPKTSTRWWDVGDEKISSNDRGDGTRSLNASV
jgi:hypothetical protein